MSDTETSETQIAADKSSKEWLREYLTEVYGVNFETQELAREGFKNSANHIRFNMIGDDFACRLLSRFNDIDASPSDGFITIPEINEAMANAKIHMEKKDILLLSLLKRYFFNIKQLYPDGGDGISRKDAEVLSRSLSKACTSLRELIEKEYQPELRK